MTQEGIPDQQTIARLIEQRDALLRLIEQFKRAAGAENSPDPIGVIEKLRRDAARCRS